MADAAEMDDLAILRVFSERDEWKRLYLKADARADELDEKVDALLAEVERLRRANQQLRTHALGLYQATESLAAWGGDWQTEAKAALAEVERLRADVQNMMAEVGLQEQRAKRAEHRLWAIETAARVLMERLEVTDTSIRDAATRAYFSGQEANDPVATSRIYVALEDLDDALTAALAQPEEQG